MFCEQEKERITGGDKNTGLHATTTEMQSSVSFPRTRPDSIRDSSSWISGRERLMSVSNRDVALEVHDLVYGEPTGTDNDSILATLERLYEPNAGELPNNPWLLPQSARARGR